MSILEFHGGQVTHFEGKVCSRRTCGAIMSTLGAPFSQIGEPYPLLGDFLMMAMAHIRVFACAGWWRSSGGRETARVLEMHQACMIGVLEIH